jgi:hypothetical protein
MSYGVQFVLSPANFQKFVCKGNETGNLGGLTKLTVLIHACHNVLFRMTALRKKTMFYLMVDL